MKRLSLAITIAALFAATSLTFGQGRGMNLFIDHSDTGEVVHVLPPEASIHSPRDTQPTFAAARNETAVYPPSYGSGMLIDHGGLEIPSAAFYAIYWNSSVATSNQTSLGYATVSAQLTAFIDNFPDNTPYDGSATDDYEIIQQYGSHAVIASTLANWGFLIDSQPTKSNIKDSGIHSYLTSLFNSGRVVPSTSTIYGIYFPAGMRVMLQGGMSCSTFCGYHGHFSYGGQQIKYAVFPYLNCSACKLSNLSVADMLTIVTSHEVREAVTDPGDNNVNAWYDAAGYEADDKCAWHNLYQMTSGGFWVQPEYSNGGMKSGVNYPGPGCIVPNQ
jgi:hypothetical protein